MLDCSSYVILYVAERRCVRASNGLWMLHLALVEDV